MAYSKNPEMRFFVGSIEVDAATGVASADGAVLPLGKKVVATLAALYERAGEVVPKATLLQAAWADSTVDDSSLWQNIHVLRGALARHAPDVKIETVKGRGYCLKVSAAERPASLIAQQIPAVAERPAAAAAEPRAIPVGERTPQAEASSASTRWLWPAAAALLCAVAINSLFEHHVPTRRTIILITTNATGKLPPLPPLPASE
jgi:DNA-binding winged helix-turn-helix (wHTH) protein